MKKHYFLYFLIAGIVNLQAQVNFVNQATNLGLVVTAGDTYLGNGISFCDYNNDGWDDITLATQEADKILFFKNVNGTFEADNLNLPRNTSQHKQVVWVDIDNDGDKDLFVTSNNNGNKLYLNTGDSNFEDITVSAGFSTENLESYGASWGDYNNDGYLDVFISNRSESNNQQNYFFQNNGDNTFTDVTTQVGIDNESHMTFCSAFFDYNNDGWQDLYLSSDKYFNQNFLYHNNGDGTFSDVSASSGTGIFIDAMTTTIGDFNNDGWFDIYITNTPTDGNVLFRNNADGTFTNIATFSGTRLNSFSWGAVFLDADNDMDLDIYVSCEFDGSNTNFRSSAFYKNRNNNTFENSVSSGFVGDLAESFSNAIGDFNNNGYPDIVVSNIDFENIYLWDNQTVSTNNWLKVNLTGILSNRDGIGSRIEISINGNKQYRYTHCGEGYLAQNSNTEFFGLGPNTILDYVKVTWLSGTVDFIENVSANQLLTIIEGSNELSTEEFTYKSDIIVYPNPSSDMVIVKSQTKKLIQKIIVFDYLGNLVLTNHPNKYSAELNISNLSQGIYFLKIYVNDNEYVMKTIKD